MSSVSRVTICFAMVRLLPNRQGQARVNASISITIACAVAKPSGRAETRRLRACGALYYSAFRQSRVTLVVVQEARSNAGARPDPRGRAMYTRYQQMPTNGPGK